MASGWSYRSNSLSTQETKGYGALQSEAPKGWLYQPVQIWIPDAKPSPGLPPVIFPQLTFFPVYGPSLMAST